MGVKHIPPAMKVVLSFTSLLALVSAEAQLLAGNGQVGGLGTRGVAVGGIGRGGLVGAVHPAVVGGGLGGGLVGGVGVGVAHPAIVGGGLVGGHGLVGGFGGLGLGRVAVGGLIGGHGLAGGLGVGRVSGLGIGRIGLGGFAGTGGLVGAVHPAVVGGGLVSGGLVGGVGHGGLIGGAGHGGIVTGGPLVSTGVVAHPVGVARVGGLVGGVGHGGLVGGVGHGGIVTGGPVVSTGVVAHPVGVATVGGGQISHQSVHKPLQGENRGVTQSKALGSPVAAVADHPSTTHGVGSNRVRTVGVVSAGHVGHGGVVGGVGHGGVIGGGLVGAAAPVASVNGLTYGGINWG